jgi:hypothetical protein
MDRQTASPARSGSSPQLPPNPTGTTGTESVAPAPASKQSLPPALLPAAELISAHVLRVAAHVWPHAWLHVVMPDLLPDLTPDVMPDLKIVWLSSSNSALSPAPGSLLFYCSLQIQKTMPCVVPQSSGRSDASCASSLPESEIPRAFADGCPSLGLLRRRAGDPPGSSPRRAR